MNTVWHKRWRALRAAPQQLRGSAMLKGSLWGLSGILVVRLLLLTNQGIIARALHVPSYGLLLTITTLTGTLMTIMGLGLDTWLLHQGGKQPARLPIASGNILLVRGLVGLLCVIGFLISRNYISPLAAVAISLSGALFDIQSLTCYNTLRARGRNDLIAMVQSAAALLLLGAIALLVLGGQPSVTSILLLQACVSGLVFVFLFQLIKRRYGLSIQLGALRPMLTSAFPFLMSDALALLYTRWPVAAIALLLGTTPVAWFAPALQVISLSYLVPGLIFSVSLPYFSRPNLEPARLKQWFRNLVLVQLLYGLLSLVLLLLLSHTVVLLMFGAKYTLTADLLLILSVVPVAKAISFSCSTLLVARDRVKLRVLLQSVILVTSVAASLVLIPVYGLVGAALLTVGTELLLMLAYSWGAYRILRSLS